MNQNDYNKMFSTAKSESEKKMLFQHEAAHLRMSGQTSNFSALKSAYASSTKK